MLPVPENSQLDNLSPSTGAGTDGWGIFSGTSAAAPQVAGIAALMLQKNTALTPAQVKANLVSTARDVTTGTTAMGDTAGPGTDLATGAGLVDAKWAYLVTMGSLASEFFAAEPEEQQQLLRTGRVPALTQGYINELMETLRSV
jgi:subtilisin family serine protease